VSRLESQFLERCEAASHRMVDVAEAIEQRRLTWRICDQIVGCGTSVGANMHEADAAMSRKDFVKCLATVAKELSECRFWLRFVGTGEWIAQDRLQPLLAEVEELRRITSAMIIRTQAADSKAPHRA
jgi:four helix bundle protein